MKTIRIISGCYGLPTGKYSVKVINCGETCEVDDQEAARLISIGVAEEVVATPSKGVATPPAGKNTPKGKNGKKGNSSRSGKNEKNDKPAAPAPKEEASPDPDEPDTDADGEDEDDEAPPDLKVEAPVE